MKKLLVSFAVLALGLVSFRTQAPSTWTIDPFHSRLGFAVDHLMIADIEGSFKIKESKITSPNADFSDASVTLVADVNSINTENEDRDKELKSPDIFDAAKYPLLTFQSTSVKKTGEKQYKIIGNLTMHGVTRPVSLDAIVNMGEHPMSKKPIAGFRVTGVVKRSDFGVWTSTPASLLGDEVRLRANLEFVKD